MNQIYKPYIQKLEAQDWGVCEEEQRKEFLSVFDKFSKELREAISSLSGVIELKKYDRQYEAEARNIHSSRSQISQDMLKHFEEIFNQWIEEIEKFIEDTESAKQEDKDAGPKSELEFWRKRTQKLTCISE